MSTRLKIFISYLVMGIIPIFLLIALMCGTVARVVNTSPFLKSLDTSEENLQNGMDSLMKLDILARENPEKLYDKKLLADSDAVLSSFHVGIILVGADNKLFYSSHFIDAQTLLQKIDQAIKGGRYDMNAKRGHGSKIGYTRIDTDTGFIILRKTFVNAQPGAYYIAIETGPVKTMSDIYAGRYMLTILGIMAAVIILMTFLVTRGLMHSLEKLKDGVRHISDGDLNFSVRTDKNDEVGQVINSFEEMRLRLKTSIEAQVREDENRRELVANISHDLKTPVTAIKGYVEGLIDGVADTPEKREKYLSTILGKTIALDRMIDDLFLYSSLDAGSRTYHFETLPAAELLESLCSETKLDLSEKSFEVDCDIQVPGWVRVKADRQMITRLQHNLTENAAKYCREDGRKAFLSASIKDGELVCTMEDNGTGIKPEELPHIFERFYRADAARTSTIGGTGLGLQISHRIVEDHGGRIWAESSYGEYTRIIWTLPVIPGEGGGNDG
ncbi:MAG TPA: HAMP domain-containing sensor histidine kinase [Clostridia bacterium]|nr:HAMP domain-containing sensor histidine kinase [Clostridia bacterium]